MDIISTERALREEEKIRLSQELLFYVFLWRGACVHNVRVFSFLEFSVLP